MTLSTGLISIAQVTGGADAFDLNGLWRPDGSIQQNDEAEVPALANYSELYNHPSQTHKTAWTIKVN